MTTANKKENKTVERDNLYFYNQGANVPDEYLKPIANGRLKGKSDINPQWRIRKLTEMFGVCGFGWKIKTIKKWVEEGANGVKCAFVDIELFIKIDGEWSDGIEGSGGSSFIANESKGLYTSDECFKMATTDALSVACKMLGIAGAVYEGQQDTKYNQENLPTQPQQQTQQRQTAQRQTAQRQQPQAQVQPQNQDLELQRQDMLYDILCILCENDLTLVSKELERFTSFTGRNNQVVAGVTDVTQLKGRRLEVTLDKVKKEFKNVYGKDYK